MFLLLCSIAHDAKGSIDGKMLPCGDILQLYLLYLRSVVLRSIFHTFRHRLSSCSNCMLGAFRLEIEVRSHAASSIRPYHLHPDRSGPLAPALAPARRIHGQAEQANGVL